MGAEDISRQAALDILAEIGQDATYSHPGDDPVSCKVNVEIGVDLQPEGNAQVWEKGVTVEYAIDEVGREADSGDTFTIGTVTYTVKRVVENDGYFVKVAVA